MLLNGLVLNSGFGFAQPALKTVPRAEQKGKEIKSMVKLSTVNLVIQINSLSLPDCTEDKYCSSNSYLIPVVEKFGAEEFTAIEKSSAVRYQIIEIISPVDPAYS